MPTIAAGMLPPPHLVAVRDASVLLVSAIGRLPFHRQPDPDLAPRAFTLTWGNLVGAAADAIRRHYDEHPQAVFAITLRGGEVVRVQLSAPPTIQWASASFASSVTAEAEEVIAFE